MFRTRDLILRQLPAQIHARHKQPLPHHFLSGSVHLYVGFDREAGSGDRGSTAAPIPQCNLSPPLVQSARVHQDIIADMPLLLENGLWRRKQQVHWLETVICCIDPVDNLI